MTTRAPQIEWAASLPILILVGAAIAVLLADVVARRRAPTLSLLLSLLGMGSALVLMTGAYLPTDQEIFSTFLKYDFLGRWGAMTVLSLGCLIALISPRTIRLYDLPPGEYYALLVFAILGMVVLCLAHELLTIFLSIETIAIAIYVLCAIQQGSPKASEAALKYFVLGAFAGGFLIFGFAFLYGSSDGSTLVAKIGASVGHNDDRFVIFSAVIGTALALVGFAFKLTLVPFHLYAADVFEGAPTPVAALLATGSKAAGVIALMHILGAIRDNAHAAVQVLSADTVNLLWVLSAASILVGNFVGVMQRNIKRMLAYSSIGHGGYILIGVIVFLDGAATVGDAEEIVLTYLIAYVIMKLVAFGVALTLGRQGEGNVEDYAGLARRSPALAATMAIAMLSLTGVPGTVGFIGKLYVFAGAIQTGYVWLVIIAILGTAVSAYYYLRVVVYMYMFEPRAVIATEPVSYLQSIGLTFAAVPMVGFGIMPQSLLTLFKIL